MSDWTPTSQSKPEQGRRIDWIAPDGTVIEDGSYSGGVVWFLPGGMYVYYLPTFWRYRYS